MSAAVVEEQFYYFADFCEHEIGSDDEEPGDGIHVGDDSEGLLICLESPMPPQVFIEPSSGFYELPGITIELPTMLVCEKCGIRTIRVKNDLRWMQRHVASHETDGSEPTS